MFTSNISMRENMISVTLTVAWMLVQIGWFEHFRNCWDFPKKTVSNVYTEWCKNIVKILSVSSISEGGSTLLMRKVKGEWSEWSKLLMVTQISTLYDHDE